MELTSPLTKQLEFPWITLGDIDSDRREQRVFLFYGQSGSGKTFLAAQFPEPLILACDPGELGGALSAIRFKPKHFKVKTYDQLLSLIPTLKESAGKEFKTLIIDSTSYLQRVVMNSILQMVGREIPRYEEWNLLVTRMRKLINTFADLPVDVIFTAVEDTTKDEVTGKIYGGPSLNGQLAKELPQACDIVLRLFVRSGYTAKMEREVSYRFQSAPDDVWFARDRLSVLPLEGILGKNPSDEKSPIDPMVYFRPLLIQPIKPTIERAPLNEDS